MRRTDVIKLGGKKLFRYYPSLVAALKALYPQYEWDAQRFVGESRAPLGYWKETPNLIARLEQVEKRLDIRQVKIIS